MSDVFISYTRSDRPRVQGLVDLLRQEGFDVWWDQDISPGMPFATEIEKQIKAAKCVIVIWSKTSVDRGWVLTEADYANTKGKLIPILFDQIEIPFAFRLVQTADLINWRPGQHHPGMPRLLKAISDLIGRAPKSEPAAPVSRPAPRAAQRSSPPKPTFLPKVDQHVLPTTVKPQPVGSPTTGGGTVEPQFPSQVDVKWALSLPGEVHQPAVVSSDGMVYLITRNGALVCADSTGKKQWSAIVGGGRGIGGQGITLSPTGDVLAVTDSAVHCISANGKSLWRWTENGGVTSAPAVGSDGIVYAMTNKSTLWAVSKNGQSIWSRALCQVFGGGSWPSPAYCDQGLVFAACKGRNVYGVSAERGELLWEFAVNDAVAASPAVGSNGIGYFASNAGWVFAIRPDGQEKWVASVSGGSGRIAMIDAPLTVSKENTLYVAPRHGKVYAIAPDGEILWNAAVGGQGTGDRPVAVSSDGRVYAATTARELVGLSSTGQTFMKIASSAWMSAPAVGPDDTLYVGMGTKLFALQIDG